MPEVPKEIPFMMLRNFFEHAAGRNWRFLLLLDELEHLVKGENAKIYDENFFSALRSIIQIKQISWITASYRIVYMPNTTTSPFTNIMQSMPYVGPLSPADAQLLAAEPAARAGHPFELEDVEFVTAYAGRMPFLLQKTSLQLYKSHLNGKRGKPAHKEVVKVCSLELEKYFDSQLGQLTGEEKLALRQLVHAPELEPELSNSVDVLEGYGFIERVKGGYKILGNAFRDYLASKSKIKINS